MAGVHKQLANTSEGKIETIYVGGLYKKITKIADSGSTKVTHRHFIQAGGRTVAVYDRKFDITADTASEDTRYWHRDHHGSIVMTTQGPNTKGEAIGAVVMRTGFKAWGGRRGVPGMDQDSALYWAGHGELASQTVTRQGYTGHEHMDDLGLIHMNGRVYDPTLGRFLSADPHVQAPTASQSYNRYAYVLNNPLRYSDPSGYFWKELYENTTPLTKNLMENDAVHAVGMVALNAFPVCYVWCAAVGNGVRGYMMTGSESAGTKGAIYTAASGAVAFGVGGAGLDWFPAAMLHGASQAAIASMQGGEFGAAFASAFVSHALGPDFKKAGPVRGTIASALVGGTISKVAGGSFANGAVTAAFVHTLNYMKHQSDAKTASEDDLDVAVCAEKGVDCSDGTQQSRSAVVAEGTALISFVADEDSWLNVIKDGVCTAFRSCKFAPPLDVDMLTADFALVREYDVQVGVATIDGEFIGNVIINESPTNSFQEVMLGDPYVGDEFDFIVSRGAHYWSRHTEFDIEKSRLQSW